MKKVYTKPAILFDSFELSQSIAAGCEIITGYARNVCAYELRTGQNIFLEGISDCTTIEAGGEYNGICYHVPIDTNNLFTS